MLLLSACRLVLPVVGSDGLIKQTPLLSLDSLACVAATRNLTITCCHWYVAGRQLAAVC
jgi:hypothetical protein